MRKFSFLLSLVVGLMVIPWSPSQAQTERPNIVWLVTEDNSQHFMRLYEEGGVPMPHIEALAQKGIVFNHAFSNGPVCSVARSTIISGCYAPRIGAQYHRRMERVPMPEGLKMFPWYLRQAGYYTTNNAKEDYNIIKTDGVWDESSRKATYRNRSEGQPFFHVQNFGTTHEGKLHFSEEKMLSTVTQISADQIKVFPYHPDTELARYTYAWHRDLHQTVDEQMGQFIRQLEEDGLMENTIIFYYGDHGGVLPRSKGYIYESGLHVPMVVYVPEKWQHFSPVAKGQRTDAFVQFIDLGPTVLNLAGAKVPEQMDGKPFLGQGVSLDQLNARKTTFSYADRFDEKYDLVRGYRKDNYKYLRNYQPFNVDALFNFYRCKMLMWQEWEELYKAGELNEYQAQFFQPRTQEALYDLENDPHEIHNLLDDPAYQEVLLEMRASLQAQVKSLPDLSFFPEPYFLTNGRSNPVQFGQQNKDRIAKLIDIADLSLLPFAQAKKGIKKALKSSDPWERYWGLVVCSSFGETAAPFMKKARKLMTTDSNRLVQMRAIEFWVLNGEPAPKELILKLLDEAPNRTEANLMLNTVALFQMVVPGFEMEIPEELFEPEWLVPEGALVNRRVDYINGN
jgi:arylsulfatase A-like enzyme